MYLVLMDPEQGGPITYVFGSATLLRTMIRNIILAIRLDITCTACTNKPTYISLPGVENRYTKACQNQPIYDMLYQQLCLSIWYQPLIYHVSLWRWVALGRWVVKLVARLLATAALWDQIQTSLKIQNGQHKQKVCCTVYKKIYTHHCTFFKPYCIKMNFVQFQLSVQANTELLFLFELSSISVF
jgi:hypothetical protein